MATKVKGDKIKEGSIPLSALGDDVKKEFEYKYGVTGYVGELSSSNTKIESSNSELYLYIKGEVYDTMNSPDIILNNSTLSGRPLLKDKNKIFTLYKERYEKYKKCADFTIDNLTDINTAKNMLCNIINTTLK